MRKPDGVKCRLTAVIKCEGKLIIGLSHLRNFGDFGEFQREVHCDGMHGRRCFISVKAYASRRRRNRTADSKGTMGGVMGI